VFWAGGRPPGSNALVAVNFRGGDHPGSPENALVVLKENLTVDPCELRSFLQQTFAPWQVPDAFVVVAELPHTSTGKLLKSKLREEFNDWQWDTDRSVAVS